MNGTVEYEYIETEHQLKKVAKILQEAHSIAVDLECENNLHHYGMYISLIQLSTRKAHFIVDVLKLKDIEALLPVFEDSDIQKIFHDISFDVRILRHQFLCYPKNIFDTELAARFLGKPNIGLGPLLNEYFGFEKQKKFQMADWTRRPLTEKMLAYAIQDTAYLIALRDELKKELKEKKVYQWFKEELHHLEYKELNNKHPTFKDVKGYKQLNDEQKNILKRLYALREKFAKHVDMPPHFIINNSKLIDIVKRPPRSGNAWRRMKGVHPIVKRRAHACFEEVNKARRHITPMPEPKPKRYSQEQRNHFARLNQAREKLAKKHNLYSHLILSKEQMQHIVLDKNLESLRNWQKRLLSSFDI